MQLYIEAAVKSAGIPIYEVADKTHISDKTLYKIRSRQQQVSPDKTALLAATLRRPELVRYHCQNFEIGRNFHLVYLDGRVREEGHAILLKSMKEIEEFMVHFQEAMDIMNKNVDAQDYTSEEKSLAKKILREALDVRHCIETLEMWYAKTFGIDELTEEIKEHNQKCIDRKYVGNRRVIPLSREIAIEMYDTLKKVCLIL